MQLDLLNGGLEDPTVGEYVPTPEWVLRLKKRPWPAVVRECCWVGWLPRTMETKMRRAGR